MKVLGAPIGSDAFAAALGAQLAEGEGTLLNELLGLNSLQTAWLLLLYCAAPRANYHLRTTPLQQVRAYAEGHDARVMNTLTTLLGARAPDADNFWTRQAQQIGRASCRERV